MFDFISSAAGPLKIYWIIALVASVLFVLMTVLSFLGADSDVDADVDGDGGPGLFSFKSLVNFLFAYGWASVLLYKQIDSIWLLNVVAVLVGIGFILLVFGGLTLMLKLAKDGSFRIESTVGKTANVYLRIPAGRTASGKVQVSVGGAVHEIDAWTDGEELSTGDVCKIVKIIDNSNVLVEKQ